ncbi:hypothetical protein HY407_02475 [Candidatus Gottesmanbacteria bacterium]|nr:hypothetical protein [Candidatus Gottesmanbacteria bacterium]
MDLKTSIISVTQGIKEAMRGDPKEILIPKNRTELGIVGQGLARTVVETTIVSAIIFPTICILLAVCSELARR